MRESIEQLLRGENEGERHLYPSYEDYCFANIPGTIQDLLDLPNQRRLPEKAVPDGDWDRIIVFVVDGFGLSQWKKYSDHELIQLVDSNGIVTPLTSIYPSETAAAMTTFHTGQLPCQHSAIGWNIYDPEWDSAFQLFSAEVKSGCNLSNKQTKNTHNGTPIYPEMKANGVEVHHVVPMETTYDGALHYEYDHNNPGDAGKTTIEAVAKASEPSYIYCYLPQIDSIGHQKGVESIEYQRLTCYVLDVIHDTLKHLSNTDNTLVLIAADHGQINREAVVDLEQYDWLMDSLKRHSDGEVVRYAGSPRNLHIHLRDNEGEVETTFQDELGATVWTRDEVLDAELFGDTGNTTSFKRRIGDLVITHPTDSLWYGSESEQMNQIGLHGGLHPDEMLVPFATISTEAVDS